MTNVFTGDAPSTEPKTIVAGDFLTWKRTDLSSVYSNSLYTLTYNARLEGDGSTEIEITASADDDDYLVEVASAVTAAYAIGDYKWSAYITRDSDSERTTIDSGSFEVIADSAVSTTDPRSHAKIMLDEIQSLMEGRATADVSNYSIQGRALTKLSIQELREWRNYYNKEVIQEEQKERIKNGESTGNLIKASFSGGI